MIYLDYRRRPSTKKYIRPCCLILSQIWKPLQQLQAEAVCKTRSGKRTWASCEADRC